MTRFKITSLKAINDIPQADPAKWLHGAEDSIRLLVDNAEQDEILIYASGAHVLIHGVLAPVSTLTPPDSDDLQHTMFPGQEDGWAIQRVYGGGEGHRMYLEPPLRSKSFVGGEKLIFRRTFDGVQKGRAPIELSQKLVHSLGIYFVSERNAYCRLDERGDIEDVIRITYFKYDNGKDTLDYVTILRADLDKFMALSGTALVLRFDFTRVEYGNFPGWGDIQRFTKEEGNLFVHGGVDGPGSYANGAYIVWPQVTVDQLVQAWKDDESGGNRQYATFKIFDRKNNRNVETSCAPGSITNYFTKNDLPWEISPAFFRPEVLTKYKADPEKYTMDDRSIGCRGAWYLKSYDINEEGLIHAYIGDLQKLPFEEQLHWLSCNVWPKGGISARAHQTDIVGDWHTEYEALQSLKHAVVQLERQQCAWWKKRGDAISDASRYPATDSPKEWADEVLHLDQFLVEGFLLAPLRKIAQDLSGHQIDARFQTLRVIQEILYAKGMSEAQAKAVVEPIQRLHGLRSVVRGHATTDKKQRAESEARTAHGTFRAHFTQLTKECDGSFRTIVTALAGLTLE